MQSPHQKRGPGADGSVCLYLCGGGEAAGGGGGGLEDIIDRKRIEKRAGMEVAFLIDVNERLLEQIPRL